MSNLTKKLPQLFPTSGDIPEGVSFDGVTDYLSRSSDLVGNTDSKTFTFSCWVYHTSDVTYETIYQVNGQNIRIYIDDNDIGIKAKNASSSGYPLNILGRSGRLKPNQWNHFLVSIDMTNQSGSKMYINDTNESYAINSTWTNESLYLTGTSVAVASLVGGSQLFKGRLSNLFLAYEYVDLSIESNRRMFITADGLSTNSYQNWLASGRGNVILSLPMKDKATCHINEAGTGDFVQNGLIETADVGANQWQCKASYFDGVDDYLSRTSLTGVVDGKQFTLSFNVSVNSDASNQFVFTIYNTVSYYGFEINLKPTANSILLRLRNSAGIIIFASDVVDNSIFTQLNINNNINIAIDMSSQSLCKFFVNGIDRTDGVTISTFTTDALIDFTINQYRIGASAANYFNGSLGEFYFDTTYIDLSTNNPFWDSETNKPIPVRKAMETLGSNPLICMPIDASNPTKNYGSGGDFTLNGGGLTGARGISEYISRSANVSNGYLTLPITAENTFDFTKFTIMITFTNTSTSEIPTFEIERDNGIYQYQPLSIAPYNNGGTRVGIWKNADYGSQVINCNGCATRVAYETNTTYTIWISSKTATSGSRNFLNTINHSTNTIYSESLNDTSTSLPTCTAKVGDTVKIGAEAGSIIHRVILFDNSYESYMSYENFRNKYFNQLGYPRDLQPEIDAGNIPQPLIYLTFDDPSNLGKNLGTIGDFTVNGTVTQGADFSL